VGEGSRPLGDRPGEGAKEAPPLTKLAACGLHEIRAAAYRDRPAALAFALAFLGLRLRPRRGAAPPVLWCSTERAARDWGAPYGPGLLALGLDPALLLIVEARNAMDAAWALEEGLKSRACSAALGQIDIAAPLAARRLGLAAQTSRTPCLLLSGHQDGLSGTGLPGTGLPGTLTRWRVAAAASNPAPFDAYAPGAPAWHLMLERCRGSAPERSWTVEFSHAYGFRLAPASAARAAYAGEARRAHSG
jgi:protein ImuA